MVTELLHKYIWLVQTFIRAGEIGLSLEEIFDRWESRFDTEYSRRTFNNHRAAVEEVFGIRDITSKVLWMLEDIVKQRQTEE